MSKYMPITEELPEVREAFDRWFAKHDREVAVRTLREAADDIAARANGPELIKAVDRWGAYYSGVRTAMQNEESALRLRADMIERTDR